MTNIALGTHFSDGLRSGPIYGVDSSGSINTGGAFNKYGPGVLHSVQHSYNIKASPANTGGGYTGLDNIVESRTGIAANTYLTLRGDAALNIFTLANGTTIRQYVGCTYYTIGTNGLPLVQLDWPKVPSVTITGANLAGPTRVTLFGYDFYGVPLQHTYVVQNIGTYPTVTAGATVADDNLIRDPATAGGAVRPAKAFYQITGVFVNGAIDGGASISVGASAASTYVGNPIIDIFGIPYVVKGSPPTIGVNSSCGVITSIQWGIKRAGGPTDPIDPITEITTRGPGLPLTTFGSFVPADLTNPATAITGDVRGLYAPSLPTATQTDGVAPPAGPEIIDWTNLIFTAYISGEDTWINQLADDQQEFMTNNPTLAPRGANVVPLAPANAYGLPQFYTGQPS